MNGNGNRPALTDARVAELLVRHDRARSELEHLDRLGAVNTDVFEELSEHRRGPISLSEHAHRSARIEEARNLARGGLAEASDVRRSLLETKSEIISEIATSILSGVWVSCGEWTLMLD